MSLFCCIEEFHETTTHVILATSKYGHGNQSDCKYLCSTTPIAQNFGRGKCWQISINSPSFTLPNNFKIYTTSMTISEKLLCKYMLV